MSVTLELMIDNRPYAEVPRRQV